MQTSSTIGVEDAFSCRGLDMNVGKRGVAEVCSTCESLPSLLAMRVETEAKLIPVHPVEANVVFIALPESLTQKLRERGGFYNFIASGVARFRCSWQTTEADITALVTDIIDIENRL
jgi:hypothetical protein